MLSKLWARLLDQFNHCPQTRWCPKCNRRIQCQYPRNHKTRMHGHLPDPSRKGHTMEWSVADARG